MSQNSLGNTDPQRGAKEADALKKGERNFMDNFSGLSDALSNDENGFSNKEGFNTERGHEPLAERQNGKIDSRGTENEVGGNGADSSTSEADERD